MSEHRVVLSPKEFSRLPGRSSGMSSVRLRGQIEALLVEAGIGTRAWLTKDGRDLLAFEVVQRTDTDVRALHFKFEVPKIYLKQKRKGDKYMESASWRFFHDYMEHRLYAVILGVSDVVEEFTDHLVMMLPDGREQTVKERITESLEKNEREALPYIRHEA